MSKPIQWIPEAEAAQKVRRHPRNLRKYVKTGKWPVAFTALNGRRYMYSEKDIEKLLLSYSNTL